MFKVGDKVIVNNIKMVVSHVDMDNYIGVSGVISEIQNDRSFSGIKTEYNTFVKFDERSNLENVYFSKEELIKC